MIRLVLHLIATVLVVGQALAQDAARPPFDASRYPKELQRALGDADKECKFQGGGDVTFAPDTVQTVDLTGDGRPDYIIQFGEAKCTAGTRAVFCGSGGCLINILVTLPDGRIRKVFDNYVRGFTIRPDPASKATAPRSVTFELHGGYCGGHGTPSCHKERTITAQPFDFKLSN